MSVVFACIILKEKLTLKKVIAILISFWGVVIVIGGAAKDFNAQILLGGAFCILGAVSYGVFTALNKKMNYNKTVSLMTGYFVAFVLSTVVNLINGEIFIPRGGQTLGLLWSGVFTVAIADTMWAVALEKEKTQKYQILRT